MLPARCWLPMRWELGEGLRNPCFHGNWQQMSQSSRFRTLGFGLSFSSRDPCMAVISVALLQFSVQSFRTTARRMLLKEGCHAITLEQRCQHQCTAVPPSLYMPPLPHDSKLSITAHVSRYHSLKYYGSVLRSDTSQSRIIILRTKSPIATAQREALFLTLKS